MSQEKKNRDLETEIKFIFEKLEGIDERFEEYEERFKEIEEKIDAFQ
ncbi:unnamed protein product [marine sediment metagenome]|uniref:Uncharacterized protein n=1 Tax=marine sediment metagenome TaxID=412755 RepID=X0US80_9ZZZZ